MQKINEPHHDVFGVSDQVQFTQIGLHSHRRWLEAFDFRFRKKMDCTIYVAKTNVFIQHDTYSKALFLNGIKAEFWMSIVLWWGDSKKHCISFGIWFAPK